MPAKKLSLEERDARARAGFWSRVHKTEGCWFWTGTPAGDTGYGLWRYLGKPIRPHRMSWMLERGAIPAGLLVCHRCDVRLCVRPSHLFLGTHSENMRDAGQKGRLQGRPTRPLRGEESPSAQFKDADVVAARQGKLGSPQQIADRFGVSVWAVYDMLSGRTWAHVSTNRSVRAYAGRFGVKNRLTASQATAIRRRYLNGDRPVDLAREYGVSASTVSNIGAGRIWKVPR